MRQATLALVFLLGLCVTSSAQAQRLNRTAGRTYQPAYQLYSPYLMLFGNDFSFAQRYFFFVAPAEANRAYLAEQQYRLDRLDAAPPESVERMRVAADAATNRPLRTERRRGVGSPSAVGGFNDTMHFFPARNAARR